MFCSLSDLATESDVEQKLLWPLLTTPFPTGLGLSGSDILTKPSIRRIAIGKGTARKLYFPDYIVVFAALPLLVIEAKAPSESLELALSEARLYGNELNALLPSGTNPCFRVVVCNGSELWSTPLDNAEPDIRLSHSDLSVANPGFARLSDLCQHAALQDRVDAIRRNLRRPRYRRAISLIRRRLPK